jgi:hypothetical protein
MKIQINSDKQIAVNSALSSVLESTILRALDRFQSKLTRIEVHLSDVNGKKPGIRDKHCQLEARATGRKPVSVEYDAHTVKGSVQGAAGKMKRLLQTSFGRLSDRISRGKRATASGVTLERLDRGETVLAELGGSEKETPHVDKYAKTATNAMKKARLLVSADVGSRKATVPASGASAGRSPKKKAIYQARRKSWPRG